MENEELVLSFMEVSNLPIEEAQSRLREAGFCLELAIQQYYDSQQATEPMTSNTSSQNIQPNDDDEFEEDVRAPLPRAFDTLVEEESSRNMQLIRVGRQFVSSFRDLKREMEIQEDIARGHVPKKKFLEDIYRNPIDITSNFDFNYAKIYGQKVGKWLAVLINDENFDSLSFNRDIFNEPSLKVKKLLREKFILLRKNSSDAEGHAILRLYNLLDHTIPVFLLIEPLTGELKKNFGECKKLTLRCVTKELKKYSTASDKQLIYNSSFEDSDDDTEAISTLTYTASTSSSLLITNKPSTSQSKPNPTATAKQYETDEESFASISTNEGDETSEKEADEPGLDETEEENGEAKVLDSDDEILKNDDGPQTAILLKLKDENHKFKYPAKRTVGQLINYIFRNYLLPTGIYDNQTKRFSLFSQIHNTCLTNLSNDKSLEEMKIHPSIVLMHNTLEKE